MFTGDNVLGHGTAVFESLPVYLASLRRMVDFGNGVGGWGQGGGSGNGRAYPGHGDVVEDRNGKIEEYIRHRAKREGEVLSALGLEREGEDGGRGGEGDRGKTAMEIVEVVYRDYPRGLWEPARGGVMQILW